MKQPYYKKYINDLSERNEESKKFLIRQIERMPDFYRFGVQLIIGIFFIFNLKPKNLQLLDRLITSLLTVKNYEGN